MSLTMSCLEHQASVEHALAVDGYRLERVESDRTARAVHVLRAIAVVLTDQAEVVHTFDRQNLLEALIHVHILAPMGVSEPELLLALHVVLAVQIDCAPREDLDRAVQSVLAVVDVGPIGTLDHLVQAPPQAVWEENGVWVDLDCPVVEPEAAAVDNLLPEGYENSCIEGRARITSNLALQVALDDLRVNPRAYLDLGIAEDSMLLAGKDAHTLGVLHLEERQLVALWLHQSHAVERAGPAVADGQPRHEALPVQPRRHCTVLLGLQQTAHVRLAVVVALPVRPGPRAAAAVDLALLAADPRAGDGHHVAVRHTLVLDVHVYHPAVRVWRAQGRPDHSGAHVGLLRTVAPVVCADGEPETVDGVVEVGGAGLLVEIATLGAVGQDRGGHRDVRLVESLRGRSTQSLVQNGDHSVVVARPNGDLLEHCGP
mmetsp:Transcript_57276/g.153008  ORF Transcript_57276/g.153008 Transcript_57276/m.153008 type:complete len:429 (-) Transcript_57276:95-1381(-)